MHNLKQALGTLADAVSEEFEDQRFKEHSESESQNNKLGKRIEHMGMTQQKHEQELINALHQIDQLRDQVK